MAANPPPTQPPPMQAARCESCAREFERDAPWKRLCVACWRRERQAADARTAPPGQQTLSWANRPAADARTAPAWTPDLQAERDRLAAEVADLRTRLAATTKERDQQAQLVRGIAVSLQSTQQELNKLRRSLRSGGSPPIDADLIGRLIKLCHPDKHPEARQAEATAATQDLLQLRKRIQGGA